MRTMLQDVILEVKDRITELRNNKGFRENGRLKKCSASKNMIMHSIHENTILEHPLLLSRCLIYPFNFHSKARARERAWEIINLASQGTFNFLLRC